MRLNSVPFWCACGVVIIILLLVGYTYHQRVQSMQTQKSEADTSNVAGAGDRAKDALGPGRETRKQNPPGTPDKPDKAGEKTPERTPPPVGTISLEEAMRRQAWAAYMQRAQAEQTQAADDASKALTSGTDVSLAGPSGGTVTLPGADGALGAVGPDPSAQAEKRAFMNQGGDVFGLNENLPGSVHAPKPDTIMEGTPIPGNMKGGVTTDAAGMLVGTVGADICDSLTGRHLLIPWGTKVVGIYDNSVSAGQERIPVVWSRFIFPDTSSRQIGSMEGADQGGYAGFHDKVDTHFWPNLKHALLVSIIGAGVQLAQPPPATNGFYSPWSTGTGAMTNQMQQFAMSQANAGAQIPNTLETDPGYPFVIMVRQDMPMPVYHGMACPSDGSAAATQSVNLGPILQ